MIRTVLICDNCGMRVENNRHEIMALISWNCGRPACDRHWSRVQIGPATFDFCPACRGAEAQIRDQAGATDVSAIVETD